MATIPVWQYSKMIVESWLSNSTKWLISIVAIILLFCVWQGEVLSKIIATMIICFVVVGAISADINSKNEI